MPPPPEIKQLYQRYLANELTPEELNHFLQIINQAESEKQVSAYMDETWKEMFDRVQTAQPTKVVQFRLWKKIAIAAAIIIAISTIAYLVIPTKEGSQTPPIAAAKDIPAPSTNRAMITLADGTKIFLDSANNGQLFTQNEIKVIKTADGKIVYEGNPLTTHDSPLTFNTLSNPKGSKVIDITLSDGSHVWLNANSSITYPVAFIGNKRKVSITGEAYFEVTHMSPAGGGKLSNGDKLKRPGVDNIPFIVQKGDIQVTVLGTHFNVNAYDDESDIKVTLLEGRVLVSSAGGGARRAEVDLKPGQQAVLTRNSQLITHNSPDLEQTMSWKNGLFSFKGTDLKSIMRQVERWYDVEIIYQDDINEKFYAEVPRNTNVSSLFKMLEATKSVQFKVEGKKVTVMK